MIYFIQLLNEQPPTQPVPISTAQIERAADGEEPITGHLIAAFKTAVAPLLDNISLAHLTLHTVANGRESEALDVRMALAAVPKDLLVVKSTREVTSSNDASLLSRIVESNLHIVESNLHIAEGINELLSIMRNGPPSYRAPSSEGIGSQHTSPTTVSPTAHSAETRSTQSAHFSEQMRQNMNP